MPQLWEIKQQNQWWNEPKLIENDVKITTYENSSIKWLPDAYHEIQFSESSIYVVKGVRQIGKSTLLKLLARKLLNQGINPKAIFFFSLDNLSSYKEIAELIKIYLDLVAPLKLDRYYIFLDEVTLIKNWQAGIKYAVDIGLLQKATLVLSGSSAVDLKYSSERLPGRRGGGSELNKLILPISFREFLKLRGIETEPVGLNDLYDGNLHGLAENKINYPEIQKSFDEYLKVGGIPAVIDHYLKTSIPFNAAIMDVYSDVFFSTMGRLNKNRTTLLQIVRRLVQLNFSRFSWQSFTSEIDVGSFHTTLEYLEHMADSYFTGILYYLDPSKKVTRPKREKKVYVTDPVFFNLFLNLSGIDLDAYLVRSDYVGFYIENLVYSHLLRFFKKEAFDGLADLRNISFWYSEKQKEVDFLIFDGIQIFPLEVKYQSKINSFDYLNIKKVFNRGLILTRDSFFAEGSIFGVPVSVFLAGIV